MSGIAIRLARKMGLHRDGATLGLSPFDAEMRRRIWWHLVHVDFRITDVLGTRPSLDLSFGDAKSPLNTTDEDLDPDMAELPEERKGITPITLCLIRCEITDALKSISSSSPGAMRWEALMDDPEFPTTTKDYIINKIEDQLERKYMRYCDPSNTLHTYVSIIIRSSLCKMRLFAHNPRSFASMPGQIPDKERDIVFSNATKLLGYANMMRGGTPGLGKYMWQIGTSYLWNTMLYVLIEVRHRRTGPEVDRSWQLIGQVFAHYPQVSEKAASAVYTALGKWTLEVWDDYVMAATDGGLEQPITPEYINRLRLNHQPAEDVEVSNHTLGGTKTSLETWTAQHSTLTENDADVDLLPPSYDFPNLLSFEMDSNEWLQWEQLLADQGNVT